MVYCAPLAFWALSEVMQVWHSGWSPWVGLGVLMLGLAGCSPAYNWRESVHEGVPLRALMPCKPERAVRDVPLLGPGQPMLRLHMMSCQVGDDTFALAAVHLPQADGATQAMRQWTLATWASLKQTVPAGADTPAGWRGGPVTWSGALLAQSWSGHGVDHQGRPLEVHMRLGVHGAWLVQAAWYGKQADAEVRDTFFDAVRFEGV